MKRRIVAALACGASALALCPEMPASAQQTVADAPPPAGIEEIVVTATRRSERLQEVPVAVTAVSGETIKQSGFRTLSAGPAFRQFDLPELLRSGRLRAGPGGRGAAHRGLHRRLQAG